MILALLPENKSYHDMDHVIHKNKTLLWRGLNTDHVDVHKNKTSPTNTHPHAGEFKHSMPVKIVCTCVGM